MNSTGLRRRAFNQSSNRGNSEVTCSNRHSSGSNDFETVVRAEIATAIEESLARENSFIHDRSDVFKILENEARKMFDSVEAAQARDEYSRKYNKRMKAREQIYRLAGMFCLLCPMLLSFHAVMSLVPGAHIEVLQYAAQEDNMYGAASRFCLGTVNIARTVSQANTRNGFIYLWGSLGATTLLLLLVRHTTTKLVTMSSEQRAQMESMKELIQTELEKKKASLLSD